MSSIARTGLRRLLNNFGLSQINSKEHVLVRTIISKATRPDDQRPDKPKPWPYQEKRFNWFHYLYDSTSKRFDENSMIIVVEGPAAAGKSKLAKQLAEELGLLYLPEANLDMNYINEYGLDLRKLDPQVPESCRTFDIMDFLKDPKNLLTARFQIEQYQIKFYQYIDALAHLFSTGQGVILDRCCYSDFVFAEAMYKQGYLSKPAYKKYYEFRDNTIIELLKPHLVIYLDVPVPKVIENINKRALSYEKNSPVLTTEYLQTMENMYKQNYLKEISQHAELLVYDWSDEGDVEIVVEDMERIDFAKFEDEDTHLSDWRFERDEDYAVMRYKYTERKDNLITLFNIPCYDVKELITDAEEADFYNRFLEQAPGYKFETGFNSEMGDSGYLFKLKGPRCNTLPLIERRTTK